jgi:hypothetical protein
MNFLIPQAIDALDPWDRARRPDTLIDTTLLRHPAAFGEALRPLLEGTRELVLREGDELSRASLAAPAIHASREESDILRARSVLERRPSASERAARALVSVFDGRLEIALAYPVPAMGERAAAKIHPVALGDPLYAGLRRSKANAHTVDAWHKLGHAQPPHSVWIGEIPIWSSGSQQLAIEIVPNPWGYNEAVLIAHRGAGRVLAVELELGDDCTLKPARVMPSGWSYLRPDRTQGSTAPCFPHGAPAVSPHVRVPDLDLFALCATRTWAASPRDTLWLCARPGLRALE